VATVHSSNPDMEQNESKIENLSLLERLMANPVLRFVIAGFFGVHYFYHAIPVHDIYDQRL